MAPQIVLMTGSSSGIGLATAKRLALDPDQRYIVIATVIAMSEKADLEAAVGVALNKTIFIEKLDITKEDDITTVVESTLKTHGRIDVLLNIAGIMYADIPELITRDQMERIFDVNVFGAIRLTQAVLPHMKRRKTGKIIVTSSVAGKTAYPYMEIYSSTKFALEGFFQGLAVALRAFGIRVCLVEPGGIDTGLQRIVFDSIAARIQDESIDEIDRRQLRSLDGKFSEMKKATGLMMTVDGAAEAIATRCLDVDEPVLAHLLPEEMHDAVKAVGADITGETNVATMKVLIENS